MSNPIDPETLIVQLAPGSAVYARTYRPEPHTDFMVREESKVIEKLINPTVQTRAGMFIQDNVYLLVVMLWIGSHPNQLFETWWNYYQEGEGEKYFQDMATQDNIAIYFYGNSKTREKSIRVNNSLKQFFKEVTEKIRVMPRWTMKEFDLAREKLYQFFLTPVDLWKNL